MKNTFNSFTEAQEAGYTNIITDGANWWHYPPSEGEIAKVPGAYMPLFEETVDMSSIEYDRALLKALNESLWDLEMGWRVQQAQDVLDNPEDYGLIYDMPEEDKKPLPDFIQTPHADRAIQMLKDSRELLDNIRSGTSYYEIYHPEEDMNHNCETVGLVFKRVCRVLAKDINDAWAKAQNHNELYVAHGIRSTSVGDIIKEGEKYHMVMGSGFRDLNLEWASFDDVHTISFH